MDENNIKGKARDIGGKIQDGVGGLVGDVSTQARGKVDQVAGQAQDLYGDTVDSVRDFATEQPIKAVLSAMAVGVVLGFVLGRR